MKFVEFAGTVINTDQVKLIQKTVDRKKIASKNDEDGNVREVVDGKPYEIVFEMGDGVALKMTYSTVDEQETNYNLLLDVFAVKQR